MKIKKNNSFMKATNGLFYFT